MGFLLLLSVPNFLISICPSARKKNFQGPHVVGQDLKNCVSVTLQCPFGFGEDEDVAPRRCLSILAITEILASWQLACSPVNCSCGLGIGLNGNSVLRERLPYHPCAKPEVWCEEKDLPVSVLFRLVSKQSAVSKGSLSKLKFWYWKNTLWLMHNFFTCCPWPIPLHFVKIRKWHSFGNIFSNIYINFINVNQS